MSEKLRIENKPSLPNESDFELVGEIPFTDGSFSLETKLGVLRGEIFPSNNTNFQKVVFDGEAIPTVHRRGKQRYQQSSMRRVVLIPVGNQSERHKKEPSVIQQAGSVGSLRFHKTR